MGPILGTALSHISEHLNNTLSDSVYAALGDAPAEFDARTKWTGLIHPIRNQLHCGSCWAFSASEVLSDRVANSGCLHGIQELHVIQVWCLPEALVGVYAGRWPCSQDDWLGLREWHRLLARGEQLGHDSVGRGWLLQNRARSK